LKVKFNPEITLIVGILVFTGIYVFGALELPPPMEDGSPTQSLYPWIIAGIMVAACCSVLFKRQIWGGKEQVLTWERIKKPIFGTIILGSYIVLFVFAGYWISTSIFSFFVALLFEYERKSKVKALIYSAILGVIVPVIGYLFFNVTFGIRLPEGIWF
jgi:hypothetical protein